MTFFQNSWEELRLSIGFFTRLPVGQSPIEEQRPFAHMLWAAPIAGLIVAMAAASAFALAHILGLAPLICAALSLIAGILLTGALHEDGLADMADGFGGGHNVERKLAIMKDSAIGSYGVLAVISVFSLRLAALAELATPLPVALALVAAHMSSRSLLPAFMKSLPAARSNGLSAGAGQVPTRVIFIALGLGFLGLAGVGDAGGFPLFAPLCLVLLAGWFVFLRRLARSQIGGHSGDVLGSLQQGAETLVLLVASAIF